jgi:hypothetical protein
MVELTIIHVKTGSILHAYSARDCCLHRIRELGASVEDEE